MGLGFKERGEGWKSKVGGANDAHKERAQLDSLA